jgi:hypothetical protein
VVRDESEVCERCHSEIRRAVQLRYGDTWQHRFQVGDRVPWGGNDVGDPGRGLVVVAGYGDECPVCGFVPELDYDITIRDDVIESVRPSSGDYDFVATEKGYLVVQP